MLSAEQIEARKQGIGASDAYRIISGDWYDLWAEKTSKKEPDDLSGNFLVQMGHATEKLNLDWMERCEGVKIEHRGVVMISPDYDFLRCTLDGFTHFDGKPTVVQAKFCNPFAKIEDVIARYVPQVTHEMICTRAPQAVLSVIIGCNEPVRQVVPFDDWFANEYIERCAEFWSYVTEDKEPPRVEVMAALEIKFDDMRTVSMEGRNEWAAFAADWLRNKDAAAKFEAAKDGIKKLIEPDVKMAKGHGIKAFRTQKGISIRGLNDDQ